MKQRKPKALQRVCARACVPACADLEIPAGFREQRKWATRLLAYAVEKAGGHWRSLDDSLIEACALYGVVPPEPSGRAPRSTAAIAVASEIARSQKFIVPLSYVLPHLRVTTARQMRDMGVKSVGPV